MGDPFPPGEEQTLMDFEATAGGVGRRDGGRPSVTVVSAGLARWRIAAAQSSSLVAGMWG